MAKFRIIYDEYADPPHLNMYIHGCPHKRQHREILQRFREEMTSAAERQIVDDTIKLPIDHPIDLSLTLINPASPDLDHLLEAVFMALDGKTLKGPSILTDDRHISSVSKLRKLYTTPSTKRDTER